MSSSKTVSNISSARRIISSWDTPSSWKEEEKKKEEEEEEEKEEEEGRVRPWALPPPRVADPPLTKQCVAQVAAHVHDPLYSTHEH
jgi:hypothetical protein